MCVLRFLETFEEEVNEVDAELKEVEERIKKEQKDAKKNTEPVKKLHHLKKNYPGTRRSQELKEMGDLSSGGDAGVAPAPPALAPACYSRDHLVQAV